MRQILFEIPIPFTDRHVPVFGFGVALFLAFLAASWLATRLCRREGLNPDRVVADMGLWMFLGGLIGARLFFIVQNLSEFKSPLDVFKIWEGGLVFYGGVIGAALVFLYYTRRHGLPVWQVLDVFAPATAIGIGVGRFGCLLNGCCWGKPAELPWAITFPAQSLPWQEHLLHGWITAAAPRSLPVHPTQIYMAIDGFLLMALLLAFFPQRRRHGDAMALLMVGYAASRFLIEFLRNDVPPLRDGLTISQNISLLLLLGGVALWWYVRRVPAAARPALA
jgi:phosphatidylglycerol:prolipoprotein diacylglycerol transferase